jgi:hypothetical protein
VNIDWCGNIVALPEFSIESNTFQPQLQSQEVFKHFGSVPSFNDGHATPYMSIFTPTKPNTSDTTVAVGLLSCYFWASSNGETLLLEHNFDESPAQASQPRAIAELPAPYR